jgi:hypothetical protein
METAQITKDAHSIAMLNVATRAKAVMVGWLTYATQFAEMECCRNSLNIVTMPIQWMAMVVQVHANSSKDGPARRVLAAPACAPQSVEMDCWWVLKNVTTVIGCLMMAAVNFVSRSVGGHVSEVNARRRVGMAFGKAWRNVMMETTKTWTVAIETVA